MVLCKSIIIIIILLLSQVVGEFSYVNVNLNL